MDLSFIRNLGFDNLIMSLTLVVVLGIVRWLLGRIVGTIYHDPEMFRRWRIHSRYVVIALLAFGLLVIWAEKLQTFALSLVAVAAAFVIAFKEVIMAVLGGLIRATERPFQIGERIEINGTRGDVVDIGLFTTTLAEIGPGKDLHQYTGRKISVPHSLFFTHPVYNDSLRGGYTLHTFSVSIPYETDWLQARDVLFTIAKEVAEPHILKCREYMEAHLQREGIDIPDTNPRVTFRFPDSIRVELVVRVPSPVNRKGRIEQTILYRFAENHHQEIVSQVKSGYPKENSTSTGK